MEGSFDFFLGGGGGGRFGHCKNLPRKMRQMFFSRKGRCMIWSLSNMKLLVMQDIFSNAPALPPKNVK